MSTWKELDNKVRTAREREDREGWSLKYALGSAREYKLSTDVLDAFDMPDDNYALYSHNEIGRGFFFLPDEESEIVVYTRTITPEESRERAALHLQRTLESPDSRIILPVESRHLTEYQFDTAGSPGELEFGYRLAQRNNTRFIPFCKVNNRYEAAGSDGPYKTGFFKNREYEITYGWPELSELSFVKTLQERGIWLIACNEFFRSANRPFEQSEPLHVVLVFASKREWRIHPDYLYCRSLNSGFDLEWDPQQEDYLATPKPSK